MLSHSPRRLWQATLVVALTAVGILFFSQVTASHLEVNALLGDLWVQVDAIWRVSHGQRANSDFVTPIGPLFYGVYELLLSFQPPSILMILQANLLIGVAAALLGLGICSRAVPREPLLLLMLVSFMAAASGRSIGTPLAAQSVTYIVPYNRWCWAIALPCAIGLLIRHSRDTRFPFVLIGLGLAALFFIKLTYFVGLCILAVASALILRCESGDRYEIRKAGMLVFGTAAAVIAVGGLLWSLPAYLSDVRMIAGSNYVYFRVAKFGLQLSEAGLMLGLGVLVYYLASRLRPIAFWDGARIALMVCCAAAIMSQNHENNEAPMYFGALILGYVLGNDRAAPADLRAGPAPPQTSIPAFVLVLLLILFPVSADVGTAAVARLRAAADPLPVITEFQGTPVQALRSSSKAEVSKVLDGLQLLERVGHGHATVLPFTMGNVFSALTDTRSPRGALAIASYGRTFSENYRPPARRLLGDAEFLLIGKKDGSSLHLWRLYGPEIRERYMLVGKSEHWLAWRMKSSQFVIAGDRNVGHESRR